LCSDMGTKDQSIFVGLSDEIAKIQQGRIHCLIFPAKLHDVEADALARW